MKCYIMQLLIEWQPPNQLDMQHFFVDNCRQSETKSWCNICGKAILMLCWKQMHFKCQCSVSGCPMRAPCQPGKDILDQWTRLDLNTNKHATWQIQGKHHKFWWKPSRKSWKRFFHRLLFLASRHQFFSWCILSRKLHARYLLFHDLTLLSPISKKLQLQRTVFCAETYHATATKCHNWPFTTRS